MPRRVFFVSLAVTALAIAAVAGAHPYGPEYYSFRTVVDVDGARVQVTVAVEIPTQLVLAEYQQRYPDLEAVGEKEDREFFEFQIGRIGEGLAVAINGQPVPTTFRAADSPINGRADERFFYYFVTADMPGALPPQGGKLEIDNEAFAGVPCYFSAWVKSGLAWKVTDSNLTALGDAAQAEDVSEVPEAWSDDEALRDLVVRLEPRANRMRGAR